MVAYVQIESPEIFFLADSHFRDPALPGEAERRRRFAAFMAGVPDDAAVFMLGDLFDFYFEYHAYVLKRYFDVFSALHGCAARGVALHFLGGNHDFWVGDFLRNEVGVATHQTDDILIEAQGRKVCCTHGDLNVPGDHNYRRIRAILRNRYVIAAAKVLHPDIMNAIATRVSGGSKKRKRRRNADVANDLGIIAPDRFFSRGNDVFIMGHVHHPFHRNYDGKDFMIVGDWIDHFTYGKLENGKLSLEKMNGGSS